MYDYISLRIDAQPCDENITDLLAAYLAENDYETFEPDEQGVTAYIRKDKFEMSKIKEVLKDFPINTDLKFSMKVIEGEDWNKEWEQNYFKPIQIDNRLIIRSSFHEKNPDASLEIIIDPKMAFGTGHHATTFGMAKMLLETNLKEKSVIDMGTGTGILAILCKKLGSGYTIGIDIDEFAVENAKENNLLNSTDIQFFEGDEKLLTKVEPADIFLANINLNVIQANLPKYLSKVKKGGKIILSGFLKEDKEKIVCNATGLGLILEKEYENNEWMVLSFIV